MSQRIYLDNNATTPVDPQVIEAMLPYFFDKPGNANSRSHAFGWQANVGVEEASQQLADGLQVAPEEIVFTSGATESINLALKGLVETWKGVKNHIITVETEHSAVLDCCAYLEKQGVEVTYLPVDSQGHIDLAQLESSIRPETIGVAIMWANNETGLIHPVEKIGAICRSHKVTFFCDGTQAVGKIITHPKQMGVDLMAFSAHKFYGPKGIGGLYVSRSRPRIRIQAQIHGGGHQENRRSGTLNVPGIVGMGKALFLAMETMDQQYQRMTKLRDDLEKGLIRQIPNVEVNGDPVHRLPHVSNLIFKYVDGEQLMVKINDVVAVASGSACTSANPDPSHVLLSMGLSELDAKASIRLSLGRFNTPTEMQKVQETITQAVAELRSESPIWQMFQAGVDLELE